MKLKDLIKASFLFLKALSKVILFLFVNVLIVLFFVIFLILSVVKLVEGDSSDIGWINVVAFLQLSLILSYGLWYFTREEILDEQ